MHGLIKVLHRMPKTIATVFLATIGLLALCYVGWRTAIHATAQEGFWFSYYCGEWPVTLSETDLDHDRKISRQEARATCQGWLKRREVNGRGCIEYIEPKTGVAAYTSCRVEPLDAR